MGGVGADHASESNLAIGLIGDRQDDVGGVDARELGEQGPRSVSKPGTRLPFLEGLPEDVGEKAHEDVRLDAIGLVMPDGSDREVGLVNAKGGLSLGELDIGFPGLRGFEWVSASIEGARARMASSFSLTASGLKPARG